MKKQLPDHPALFEGQNGPMTDLCDMIIHIWSDIVCPFCYIGKRRIEEALKEVSETTEVHLIWHSFQLDPGLTPVAGQSIYESLAERKGWSVSEAKSISAQVSEMASAAGLHYNFDSVIPANTYNGHRLIHLANDFGLQGAMKETLLAAYFTEGKNIGDPDTLAAIAQQAGVPVARAREVLSGNEFGDAVDQDMRQASRMGIRGVPYFLFENNQAISGAQPVEVFREAIRTASHR
jgi:predicted DsbA family dithiol-disulfide isomerase